MAITHHARCVAETNALVEYLRSHPLFRGFDVERHNPATTTVVVSVPTSTFPNWYLVRVGYVHKAELGRFVYVYVTGVVYFERNIYDREALVEIMHRDIVCSRIGCSR